MNKPVLVLIFCVVSLSCLAQSHYDTLLLSADSSRFIKAQVYRTDNEMILYKKPRAFGFVTGIPKTISGSAKMSFTKKSIPTWVGIVSSTAILIAFDQDILDGVQRFSNSLGIDHTRKYQTLMSFKLGSTPINVYEVPHNFNTVLYSIGEGSTSVFLCGGLYLYGKINRNYRASQTASQLMQTLITVGIATQMMKRITGRQSPFVATEPGGVWKPFPSIKDYQRHVPHYDAFPSGHLATMMATVTVLVDNYPEKKWIKVVGYGLTGIVGLAMINNEVHWAGDYPLALGLGYVCGKATVRLNRIVRKR